MTAIPKKVLVTGGHLTPALPVMDKLRSRGWQVIYIGRKHALEGDQAFSVEYRTVQEKGYKFLPLTTGRLQRHWSIRAILSLLKIPLGLAQVLIYLLSERPTVILSFGGYIAVPVTLLGWCLGIPTITHEQTLVPGLANRIISHLARKICVSWIETQPLFPADKTVFTGNPLRSEIFQVKSALSIKLTKPLLYITGGNLGAHALNLLIEKILPQLTKDFTLVHQCGNAQEFHDLERLTATKEKLRKDLRLRYLVTPYIEEEHIGWVLQHAEIVVSRAGANTVFELMALQKPAILIPLPWSGAGEQIAHARYLAEKNAAILIEQQHVNPELLFKTIYELYKKRLQYHQALKTLQEKIVVDAAVRVSDVIESIP